MTSHKFCLFLIPFRHVVCISTSTLVIACCLMVKVIFFGVLAGGVSFIQKELSKFEGSRGLVLFTHFPYFNSYSMERFTIELNHSIQCETPHCPYLPTLLEDTQHPCFCGCSLWHRETSLPLFVTSLMNGSLPNILRTPLNGHQFPFSFSKH